MRRSSRGEVLADEPSVAQHRHAVADLVDLVEEVRDEQDRDAALLQLADDAEELGDLVEVEARGGLVEHEHPHVGRDRPGDRDELLHGEGVRAEDRGRVDVESEVGEHVTRASRRIRRQSMRPSRRGSRPSAMFSATERFGSRSISWYTVLMPAELRVVGRREAHQLAVEPQLALVEREGAGDRLDEGRLAGAVLAHERVHLAREHAEVDAVDRGLRAEAHRRSGELQQRPRLLHQAIILSKRARSRCSACAPSRRRPAICVAASARR